MELVAPARDPADVLIAIYVYGSFAKGTARNSSDIDLAFVFNEKFYKDDPFRALQRAELLSAEVSKRMRERMGSGTNLGIYRFRFPYKSITIWIF